MSRGLPLNVKLCLDKALDSALLSVETYNKPAVKFKSGGYIVLMCIAWTSLFHAIFFKRGIKPFYREKNKVRFKRVDGEIQFWELATCVKEYFKGEDCAIRKNIELFIPLRNKLEHKFLPELDANIFAECQALLLNFDKIVEKEFGEDYCLRESLSFALQLFPSSRTLAMGIKMSKDAQKITRFIDKYRASISTDIMQSGEYSFKAFLIQVANHKSVDALPVQFFPYDKLTDDEKKKVERIAGLIKNWASAIGISKLRVYAQVQNLFVITGYSGMDPEVMSNTTNATLAPGTDKNTLPQARTYTFGVNLAF